MSVTVERRTAPRSLQEWRGLWSDSYYYSANNGVEFRNLEYGKKLGEWVNGGAP
jgi:hypothetical protein